MTPNQLGNVLIKMLGLSVCVHSVPSLIGGIQTVLQIWPTRGITPMWWYLATYLISLVIGIFLIVRSQSIANTFFKA